MRKLTLDEAWELCLKQWKWTVEQIDKGNRRDSSDLKYEWLINNGWTGADWPWGGCFFCGYACGNTGKKCDRHPECDKCPAAKIDSDFYCCDTHYHFLDKPHKFYKKIKSLHEIYLKTKKE